LGSLPSGGLAGPLVLAAQRLVQPLDEPEHLVLGRLLLLLEPEREVLERVGLAPAPVGVGDLPSDDGGLEVAPGVAGGSLQAEERLPFRQLEGADPVQQLRDGAAQRER
jgi:hypothetical protein